MSARYVHKYAAFDRLVLCAPWMVAEMGRRGEKVKVFAELHAPYDPDDPDGTHYRESFELDTGISTEHTRRAYARVSNTDWPTCLWIEYGFHAGIDKHGEPYPAFARHRTLGAALEAAKE